MIRMDKGPCDAGGKTLFAPATRAGHEAVLKDSTHFRANGVVSQFLDTVPDILMVLNEHRQIVYANQATLKTLAVTDLSEICGRRPGEAIACEHAESAPSGCGTGEACRACGAVNAMLDAMETGSSCRECRITKATGDAMDLSVTATRITEDGRLFVVVAVKDISDEKRRRALERIFFHDLLNTAGNICSVSDLLSVVSKEELEEYLALLKLSAESLIEEINAQKKLLAAESGELQPHYMQVKTLSALKSVRSMYLNHTSAVDKEIVIVPESFDTTIETDEVLLKRVLGNLLKNALESSNRGSVVTLGCAPGTDGGAIFSVHNPVSIPRQVQLQLFHRSFSTKGPGRGLGTYSVKLLTERYLKGAVRFTSDDAGGTCFFIELPALI